MKRARRIADFSFKILGSIAIVVGLGWAIARTDWNLRTVLDLSEIAFRISSVLAVVIGGWWALRWYYLEGGARWMIHITLTTDVLPYRDDLRLLVVHVTLENPRRSKLNFKSPKATYSLGAWVLKDDLDYGKVIPEGNTKPGAKWWGDPLPEQVDFLADLVEETGDSEYEVLPKAELDDMRVFVVKAGSTVSLFAELTIGKCGKQDSEFVAKSAIVHIAR